MADDDEWNYITSSVDDVDFYAHKDLMRHEKGYIVWMKDVLPKPEHSYITEGKTCDTRYTLMLLDDSFSRNQTLQVHEFLRDDIVASISFDFSPYDWKYIRPGSVAARIAKYAKRTIIGKKLRFEEE